MNDETHRMLHAADPARSLPPADPARVASLLEATMSTTPSDERSTRSRLLLISGAAAAAVAAAIAVGVIKAGDPVPPAASRSVTVLSLGAAAGKCAVPSADRVGAQPVAFEGTVTGVKDGVVTLAPSRFFRGSATDLVTVAEPDLAVSEMPVDFQVGQTYLVGATDGQVSICGLSGPATTELRALYEAAFPK